MKSQINVTEQIRSVLNEEKLELYMKEELIQDFTEEDGKISRLTERLQDDHPKAYVEGCDLGWC